MMYYDDFLLPEGTPLPFGAHLPRSADQQKPSIARNASYATGAGTRVFNGQFDDTYGGLLGDTFANIGRGIAQIAQAAVPQQGYQPLGITDDINAAVATTQRPIVNYDRSVNGVGRYNELDNGFMASPYITGDNMTEYDPVHVLGYSSRHGTSLPTTDYTGVMNRNNRQRHNMEMAALLGRQEMARASQNLDFQRMNMYSQDRQDAIQQRRQAEWDRMFQLTPPGQRGPLLDRAATEGHLPQQAIGDARVSDLIAASKKGIPTEQSGRPNDMEAFFRNLASSYDPARHDKFAIIRELEKLGITANTVNSLRERPGLDSMVNALIGDVQSVPMRSSWEDFGIGLGGVARNLMR